jgi:hypothetical protein
MRRKPKEDFMEFAKVISGELFEYLKDIDLAGRVDEQGDFVIWGCSQPDEDKFYQGILEYDKTTQIQGFETVEDVRRFWEEDADMQLFIENGNYELTSQ